MTLFYRKAMDDDILSPFFINELGHDITDEDWVAHIDLLAYLCWKLYWCSY